MQNFASKLFLILLLLLGSTPMKITNQSSSKALSQTKTKIDADALVKSGHMAQECIKAVMETMNPDFCWKKGGDAGKLPYGCPEGMFRSGALCFDNCRRNYQHVAGVCWDGWSSYVPGSITNFSDRATLL